MDWGRVNCCHLEMSQCGHRRRLFPYRHTGYDFSLFLPQLSNCKTSSYFLFQIQSSASSFSSSYPKPVLFPIPPDQFPHPQPVHDHCYPFDGGLVAFWPWPIPWWRPVVRRGEGELERVYTRTHAAGTCLGCEEISVHRNAEYVGGKQNIGFTANYHNTS